MRKCLVLPVTILTALALSSCSVLFPPAATATPVVSKTARVSAGASASTTATAAKDGTAAAYFGFGSAVARDYADDAGLAGIVRTYVEFLKNDRIQIREATDGFVSQSVFRYWDGAVTKLGTVIDCDYRNDFTGEPFDAREEEVMIREPIAVGTEWAVPFGGTRAITALGVPIEAAGEVYRTIEITTTYADSVRKDYYAPTVGLVRSVTGAGGESELVRTLSNYTVGEPRAQRVRFFYPDENLDRLVYVDGDISLITNELPGDRFAAALRAPPGVGDIAYVLTPSMKILSMSLNADRTACADFSSELIAEMNAGATYEALRLSALVCTIGNYFAAGKVLITVAGAPYKSGHFLFTTGETVSVDLSGAVPYE